MRGNTSLREKYRAIAAYWGLMLAVAGAVLLVPLAALVGWPAELRHAPAFLLPAAAAILVGAGLYFLLRPRRAVLSVHEGGVLILLGWLAACLLAVWPLVAVERLSFTQALFESVSGWTTTGLSVVDVTVATKIVLLFRSTMQWVGGAGLAIIMVATLLGPAGPGVAGAEGRSEQLVPHVRQSAKLVLAIYLGYTLMILAGYLLAGMGPFDAVNHAFATVSTGGFSTCPDSIGHWDSPAIEAVAIVGMLLGQLSFVTAYLLLTGNVRSVLRDSEVRYVVVFLPICAMLLFFLTADGLYGTFGKSLRVALFEAATSVTTTGFSTTGYHNWNGFGLTLLILLMCIGGGTCSTAGGLKQYRAVLLLKSIGWEIRRSILPRAAVVENCVWHGNARTYVDERSLRTVGQFFFLYVLTLAAGTAVLAAYGYDLTDALFEFASAQGTVGLSMGVTGPGTPAPVLWAQIAGMFLGRLEFFVVFTALARLGRDLPVLVKGTGAYIGRHRDNEKHWGR